MLISVKKISNKHSSFESVSPSTSSFQSETNEAVLKDLLISHPTPENMHIIPTSRDPVTNLALSSRNAYLTPQEMGVAPILYQALSAAKEGYPADGITGEDLIKRASNVVGSVKVPEGVDMKVDYFEVFDKETFEPVRGPVGGREVVIAGAVWVGRTRLIDNLLLGWDM
jgi:pantoate--beta-alanine ligase